MEPQKDEPSCMQSDKVFTYRPRTPCEQRDGI